MASGTGSLANKKTTGWKSVESPDQTKAAQKFKGRVSIALRLLPEREELIGVLQGVMRKAKMFDYARIMKKSS